MQRRGGLILVALAVLCLAGGEARAKALVADLKARAAGDQATLSASVGGTPVGRSMPSGFVGVSFEYKAIHAYTGRDPRAVNPLLVQLVRDLAPGQAPVLRIGGDSTDWTWWPVRGVIAPGGITYRLNKGWFRTTQALASALGARMILGVNLASDRPALAAAEAQAILRGIGRRYLDALEIGNEPDLYSVFAWYRDRRGRVVFSRGRHYSLGAFIKDFSRYRAALPTVPLVGPSFAELTWLRGLGQFLSAERGVRVVTAHRYPLHGCLADTTSPMYASIPNLLSDNASGGLAQGIASYVGMAHSRGLPFRIDEMNSVSCAGRRGVSDTFASALWVLDTFFNLASVGVDGVNLHTLPNAGYELFSFTHTGEGWHAFVHPEYYGAYLFARAFPPGARLLPVTAPSGPVKVWATQGTDGRIRAVLINKDPTTPVTVQLQLPGGGSDPASLEQLTAPSIDATSGVTLDGQAFGASSDAKRLRLRPRAATVSPVLGSYSIDLPAASAAMVTR